MNSRIGRIVTQILTFILWNKTSPTFSSGQKINYIRSFLKSFFKKAKNRPTIGIRLLGNLQVRPFKNSSIHTQVKVISPEIGHGKLTVWPMRLKFFSFSQCKCISHDRRTHTLKCTKFKSYPPLAASTAGALRAKISVPVIVRDQARSQLNEEIYFQFFCSNKQNKSSYAGIIGSECKWELKIVT